jgi:hypothetical protein
MMLSGRQGGQTARQSLCGRIPHHTADRRYPGSRHDTATTLNDLNAAFREWVHCCPTLAASKLNQP